MKYYLSKGGLNAASFYNMAESPGAYSEFRKSSKKNLAEGFVNSVVDTSQSRAGGVMVLFSVVDE